VPQTLTTQSQLAGGSAQKARGPPSAMYVGSETRPTGRLGTGAGIVQENCPVR